MSNNTLVSAEVVDRIAGLATAAQKHTLDFLHPNAEPADVYYTFDSKTGSSERKVAEPGDYVEAHFETSSVVDFVATHPEGGVIYYADGIVVGLVQDKETKRRRIARIEIPKQNTFKVMQHCASTATLVQQRPFWNMLRTTFRNAIPIDTISIFKSINWSVSQGSAQNVGHAKESLGKSYTSDVVGSSAIPDELAFNIGVYDIPQRRGQKYPVLCAVDCEVSSTSFRLIPANNELENARDAALEHIRQDLSDSLSSYSDEVKGRVRIVFGTPILGAVQSANAK